MKNLCVLLFSLVISASVFAQGLELKPYGFIKGDAVFSSKGVNSFGNPNLSSPQVANGVEDAAFGFTAKHTRFGLRGIYGEAIKVGGVIEMDFFSNLGFDSNVNPRIRLAYASVAWDNFEFRFGQQWDLFSPLMPTTNNVNGFLWFGGNLGFRRGQIQMIYKVPAEDFLTTIQLALGEAARETTAGLGDDNKAVIPMIQGRLSGKFLENKVVGVYFAYAKFSPIPDTSDYDYNTTGFGVDFTLPFDKYFELHGEMNFGTNLNNANLFSIAGNGKKNDDRKSLTFWANVTSKIDEHFHLVVGGGMDNNQTDNIGTGTVEQNLLIYGDLIFPITKEFSVAFELESITTKIKGLDNRTALVGFLSGKINF